MTNCLNARLSNMDPGPRPQSTRSASYNKGLAERYQADALLLSQRHDVPPALILGLMNRESNFGMSLDSRGRGDHGHGYGILQVDDRTIKNPAGGPYSHKHLDQAMGIFDKKLAEVTSKHPDWTEDELLVGAVSAYNQGSKNVVTQPVDLASWKKMDSTTTGGDYSLDVWARAQWYADHLNW